MTSGTGNDRDGAQADEYGPALDAAQRHAMEWLDSRRTSGPSGPSSMSTACSRGSSRACPRRASPPTR